MRSYARKPQQKEKAHICLLASNDVGAGAESLRSSLARCLSLSDFASGASLCASLFVLACVRWEYKEEQISAALKEEQIHLLVGFASSQILTYQIGFLCIPELHKNPS